jgi:hypothetical protein
VVLCFMENLERHALRFGIKQRTRCDSIVVF